MVAFQGTYDSPAHQPDVLVADAVNRLIGGFIAQNKPVAGISHGVTVLAWARVNGVSPLEGRTVAAWPGGNPAFKYEGQTYGRGVVAVYWHLIQNRGKLNRGVDR